MALCLLKTSRQVRFLGLFGVRTNFGHFYGWLVMRFEKSVSLSNMIFLLSLGVYWKKCLRFAFTFFLVGGGIPAIVVVFGVYTDAFAIRADSPEAWI